MQFNTDLFYVGGTKQPAFGKQKYIPAKAEWQLWFSEECGEIRMPLVVDYNFPVKPTKRQVRKLRRAFRKEAKQYAYVEPKRMPEPIDMFCGEPVTGRTPHELWEAIQHGAIVCTSIDKHIASLRPADGTETCYVFWDEVEQMSMPYASEAIAREAMATYIKHYL